MSFWKKKRKKSLQYKGQGSYQKQISRTFQGLLVTFPEIMFQVVSSKETEKFGQSVNLYKISKMKVVKKNAQLF